MNNLNINSLTLEQLSNILDDTSLDIDDVFNNIYFDIMNGESNINLDTCHKVYQYMNKLNKLQIDKISTLKINKNLFFRYLPSIELINEYLSKHNLNSNILNGISNNTNISQDEKKELIIFCINKIK